MAEPEEAHAFWEKYERNLAKGLKRRSYWGDRFPSGGTHGCPSRDILKLVVMAMYLSQEQLKLVPLLALVFALGRAVYWLAAALGTSIRVFGQGLSLLPSLAMMTANLVFVFMAESSAYLWSSPQRTDSTAPVGHQRFWG
ncbi:transmembrane protein 79-like isoform X2 [Syngnathus typhle]|uniref:transmembrane protein 79-like isoform X2 n=1 Tax=Syngnathus typhle TaxID=161592 RepID=UPI002A6B5873|nr:transmembrane protein 79-like isoform X2 [Syngnathus typhle]